jgi:hypothetical protein
MQLGELVNMPECYLERLLMDYEIFTNGDLHRDIHAWNHSGELWSGLSRRSRQIKICALLDFLGATQLGILMRRSPLVDDLDVRRPLTRGLPWRTR